jgi:hypothetical protein
VPGVCLELSVYGLRTRGAKARICGSDCETQGEALGVPRNKGNGNDKDNSNDNGKWQRATGNGKSKSKSKYGDSSLRSE